MSCAVLIGHDVINYYLSLVFWPETLNKGRTNLLWFLAVCGNCLDILPRFISAPENVTDCQHRNFKIYQYLLQPTGRWIFSNICCSTRKTSSCWEETTSAPPSTASMDSMMNVSLWIPWYYYFECNFEVLAAITWFQSGLLIAGKRRYNIKLWKTFTDCFNW